jgi:hypothetical protein
MNGCSWKKRRAEGSRRLESKNRILKEIRSTNIGEGIGNLKSAMRDKVLPGVVQNTGHFFSVVVVRNK